MSLILCCILCRSLHAEPGLAHHFGPSGAALLAKHLTHTQLPGLSSLDQMYLLALADTVANTKLEFSQSGEHKGVASANDFISKQEFSWLFCTLKVIAEDNFL